MVLKFKPRLDLNHSSLKFQVALAITINCDLLRRYKYGAHFCKRRIVVTFVYKVDNNRTVFFQNRL